MKSKTDHNQPVEEIMLLIDSRPNVMHQMSQEENHVNMFVDMMVIVTAMLFVHAGNIPSNSCFIKLL